MSIASCHEHRIFHNYKDRWQDCHTLKHCYTVFYTAELCKELPFLNIRLTAYQIFNMLSECRDLRPYTHFLSHPFSLSPNPSLSLSRSSFTPAN